ncbi:MAG: Delta-aminolevulinic acid dehydratase [Chlamydiae bacterium]|nr:Delta-aminolevulinic acid dehydratase [Chlamydiota bacterium]
MNTPLHLLKRPRRNRKSESIRALIQENFIQASNLIMPFFITEGKQVRSPISSLPNQFHLSVDELLIEVESILISGIGTVILFPLITSHYKDSLGSYAINPKSFFYKAVYTLKKAFPQLTIITDIALDPYTSHGHDGVISDSGCVLNDETVQILTEMACLQAEAGADIVAPSDMMDGRVKAIREALDKNRFEYVSIMSYTAKYASAFYKPFRSALQSAPTFGNKKSYQMNPANSREALIEAKLDEEEGADFLMIKPASIYLDIIQKIRSNSNLPVVAYHVSGEYAMIKAAAQRGWLDFEHTLFETLLSIKRAGADAIISYGAKELATWLKSSTAPLDEEPTDRQTSQ